MGLIVDLSHIHVVIQTFSPLCGHLIKHSLSVDLYMYM